MIWLCICTIALNGCHTPITTFTPTPSFSHEKPLTQIPLSVLLNMPEAFQTAIFEKKIYRAHNQVTHTIKLNLGQSSKQVFEMGLPRWFQQVEAFASQDEAQGYDLVLVPHLRHMDATPGRSIDDPIVTIEYGLDVFTPNGERLDTAIGQGQGTFRSFLYTLGSLIVGIATISTLRGTDINYEYACAFAAAEVAAFEDLIRNLQTSPVFDTYVAVVIESQRRRRMQ